MTVSILLETGQGVRWRGRRWRVLAEEQGGFLTLVGVDPTNRDQVVHPHVLLEADALESDILPLPALDVEASARARWRALHQAHMITMAGGREQLRGLDWGAVAVEPYQLVPLMRVAGTVRPRLLIADDRSRQDGGGRHRPAMAGATTPSQPSPRRHPRRAGAEAVAAGAVDQVRVPVRHPPRRRRLRRTTPPVPDG